MPRCKRYWIKKRNEKVIVIRYRISIFDKIIITIILLLIPVLFLYSYSNRIAGSVVEEQLRSSNLNELSFFLNRMDSNIENLSLFPVILSYDPHIRDFIGGTGEAAGNPLKAQSRMTEKLSLQSVSSSWTNDLTIAMPESKRVLSSNIYVNGMGEWMWDGPIRKTWSYEEDHSRGFPVGTFIRETSEPANAATALQADAVFQVRFPVETITDLLDIYRKDEQSDPFLYHPDYRPIRNSTPDLSIEEPIIRNVLHRSLTDAGQETIVINDQSYLVSYVKSRQLGWYLVDYVPVQRILSPITTARNWFYGSIAFLLMIGLIASFLLYRNVQIPIRTMIKGVKRMSRGDLSSRIDYKAKNEFDDLIRHYNEMAGRIQVLIEDVYTEKLRSREATLKQLQSQINPHFLYNSLFFVINSAMLEDRDAVVAMAENLAEYYRYTARVENQQVTLRDELDLVRHYLNIHHLRMQRLAFAITVPEDMMDEPVPRLLLQPLVENAIVHGIEPRVTGGTITITGEQNERRNRIVIADNGSGLSESELRRLTIQLNGPMTDELGCGTWNVHRRLQYLFGEGSGLSFRHAPGGGLEAVLTWNRTSSIAKPRLEEGDHDPTIDRG
ncbi:histidine kinase [Paenibacillus alkaliterrae]|uniref:sensor histidine kinase n=1 Tax=Paenibacillus alkaliterrae TaxID=320909 RepID=UPI001F37F49D|nr:histidine kinase [Paenibacillus alkaliterrae]MCF2939793.1 histidine kinase [Paenibacillus alkaliterrae]